MVGSSKRQSGPKKFGGALNHHTTTESSCGNSQAVVQATLDDFWKLHRPPNHNAGDAEVSSARDDHQVAHSSSDDDAPLVKRSRFREDVADVQGAISSFRVAEPCSMCGVLTVNSGRRTYNLPACEECVFAFRTAETADGVKDNDSFVTKNTQPSEPKSNIRDYYTSISSAVYRNNVDAATMPDIMNLWTVEAICASKDLVVTSNEAQSASDDSSSSCSSQLERKNGYVLDDFVVASSECDSDNDDDDESDGDDIV